MRTIPYKTPLPPCIEAFNRADGVLLIESPEDYDSLPPDVASIVQTRVEADAADAAEAALRAQFEADSAAKQAAEFAEYKARSGEPAYKAAAVKIAAEKLGLLAAIEAAIMALVDKASDKALYVWWVETDTISRGDAQWIEIEPAVSWGKSSADDLFALAAQV